MEKADHELEPELEELLKSGVDAKKSLTRQLFILVNAIAYEQMDLIYLDIDQIWRIHNMIEFLQAELELQLKNRSPVGKIRDGINAAFAEFADGDFKKSK